MPELQGLASFPGIQQIIQATYTLSHGITPSVAKVDIVPQQGIVAESGTLAFSFGTLVFNFPGFRIDSASLERDDKGFVWSLKMLDRRWKWQFGEINGHYNRRLPNGNINSLSEKTPHQLAELLLNAMGESGYSIAALPTVGRPEVNWIAANPAEELAALCDQYGCRVVLGASNLVEIHTIGIGAVLPVADRVVEEYALDPPERPDSIKVVGGPRRFQSKLALQAVGLDSDGTIRPIDQLNYRPTSGWQREQPGEFLNVDDNNDRQLAVKTVYRWYQVASQADGTLNVPGYSDTVVSIDQLTDLKNKLLETYLDQDGLIQAQPGYIEGVFAEESDLAYYENSLPGTKYKKRFRLRSNRIVEFDRPVYQFSELAEFEAAELYLTCSYSVLENSTAQHARYSNQRFLPGATYGTGPQTTRRDEIVEIAIAGYDSQNNVTSIYTNTAQVEQESNAALDGLEVEFQTEQAFQMQYAGLVAIVPDGAIQQVAWQVGPRGATTHASRNTEFSASALSFHERRRREEISRKLARL